MQYLNQHVEILQEKTIQKHVELCGKNCYKSEASITDESAKRFIGRIEQNNHGSVLEHGGVYLKIDYKKTEFSCNHKKLTTVTHSKYSSFLFDCRSNSGTLYTNLRVIFENYRELYEIIVSDSSLPDGLEYFTPADKDPNRRVTVRIITDRRIETEIVRHRVGSFSIESTRYVNYGKRGMAFIDMKKWLTNWRQEFWWKMATKFTTFFYNRMITAGGKPEIARSVLLSCNKADVIMTASLRDWEHFFELRSSKFAHPMVREISYMIMHKFDFRGYR